PRIVAELRELPAQGSTHHSRSQNADPHGCPPISIPELQPTIGPSYRGMAPCSLRPMEAECRGRVALVTGAGSPTGIGFAAASALGREQASVAVTSTTE